MAKRSAATGAATKVSRDPLSARSVMKQTMAPLTTKRDVEQGTYTAKRSQQLRSGKVAPPERRPQLVDVLGRAVCHSRHRGPDQPSAADPLDTARRHREHLDPPTAAWY
jgi:hypothetical protein